VKAELANRARINDESVRGEPAHLREAEQGQGFVEGVPHERTHFGSRPHANERPGVLQWLALFAECGDRDAIPVLRFGIPDAVPRLESYRERAAFQLAGRLPVVARRDACERRFHSGVECRRFSAFGAGDGQDDGDVRGAGERGAQRVSATHTNPRRLGDLHAAAYAGNERTADSLRDRALGGIWVV
jgi:hypothetical protein